MDAEPASNNALLEQLKQLLAQLLTGPKPVPSVGIITAETTAGELPLPRNGDAQLWRDVGKRIREFYGLSKEGGINNVTEAPDYLLPIDRGLGFDFDVEELQRRFQFWQVESLIDQAADLLDRGIRTRADWNDFAVRAFNLGFDLEQY